MFKKLSKITLVLLGISAAIQVTTQSYDARATETIDPSELIKLPESSEIFPYLESGQEPIQKIQNEFGINSNPIEKKSGLRVPLGTDFSSDGPTP